MADKTKLKEFLVKINKLSESLGSLKEVLEGDKTMAEEVIVVEATKAEAEVVVTETAPEVAVVVQTEVAEPTELEKALATIADLTKKLEEAEAKTTLLSQEIEKTAASLLETKEKEIKDAVSSALASYLDTPLNEETLTSLSAELDEVEKAIASKYGFKGLVKFASELSKEAASWKEEKTKAEASKLAEVRYSELETLGVAFNGEKASAQKEKVSKMTEEAFASYKEDLQSISSSITVNPDEVIKKAQEAAGKKSVVESLQVKNKYDNYSKFI